MDDQLCIKCHIRPIHIRKRSLCKRCYNYLRDRNPKDFKPKGPYIQAKRRPFRLNIHSREQFEREVAFARIFFTHKNYLYEPVSFHTAGFTYTPDFYDERRNVFIEVIGSRQRWHQMRKRYKKVREAFPLFSFEFRRPDGRVYKPGGRPKKIVLQGT